MPAPGAVRRWVCGERSGPDAARTAVGQEGAAGTGTGPDAAGTTCGGPGCESCSASAHEPRAAASGLELGILWYPCPGT